MEFTHLLGIDISKKTIDIALSVNQGNTDMLSHQFTSNLGGYKKLVIWLREKGITLDKLLIGMENTGIYHQSLVAFLERKKAFVWVENPVAIKWSMGLARGKTDKMDAKRICVYAFRNQDKAKGYSAKDESIEKVSQLLAARERLMKSRNMLLVPIQELKEVGLKQEERMVKKACRESLSALEKATKGINKDLEELVEKDASLQANYSYICSVDHVGPVTALQLLVYTHDFERFDSSKKLASYAGVAPFPYQSGTSIRGRTKVHPMANKTLKKNLHMWALSAVRCAGELKTYFDRKVKEGKNKMSILNAIRNKILQRIFACVRDQKMYVSLQPA